MVNLNFKISKSSSQVVARGIVHETQSAKIAYRAAHQQRVAGAEKLMLIRFASNLRVENVQ
jgi:hypothetical protein